MKIVAIVGSRRKKGNTSILVQEALKPIRAAGVETKLIFLGDYQINSCNGCEGCKDSMCCIQKDDMQQIYPLLLEADGLILGSPTYFYNVSADMKLFIDRCYCLDVFDEEDRSVWISINDVLGRKYAAVIAVCEQQREEDMGFAPEAMVRSLEALGYRVVETVKALNLFAAGEALKNNSVLQAAERAGEKLLKNIRLKEKIDLRTVRKRR